MSEPNTEMEDPPSFEITRPEEHSASRMIKRLCKTDLLSGTVQVLSPGSGNVMHSHSGQDGFWMVLEGRARFYGDGDEVVEDLDEYEGIVIPRETKYWFENHGEEDLVLLHVAAYSETTQDQAEYYGPREELDFAVYDTDEELLGR